MFRAKDGEAGAPLTRAFLDPRGQLEAGNHRGGGGGKEEECQAPPGQAEVSQGLGCHLSFHGLELPGVAVGCCL